ncbi:MAG: glycerol-3-phosphate dehydrogenase/oxidase [Pyrinomonadaceae bacterium]
MNRAETLQTVKNHQTPWDIIVIGGGATGVGCAIDAASRGFDVLLLEQHDFGKGTSSRSTKLVHGGVRYLIRGNISLVREALKERGILLKNAPHLIKKTAFIVPCYSLWQKLFYSTGLKIYDLLSGKYSFGKSKILSAKETIEKLPNVKTKGLRGGVMYFDGQFDDSRMLINLVTTAHKQGADVLNYAKVASLIKDQAGKITGVVFQDQESAERFTVKAKVVINATGAFSDSIRKLSEADAENIITFSQGVHLVSIINFYLAKAH